MNTRPTATHPTKDIFEALADQLASTAYNVVLEHKRNGSWLDLELDLWRAVSESLRSTQVERASVA